MAGERRRRPWTVVLATLAFGAVAQVAASGAGSAHQRLVLSDLSQIAAPFAAAVASLLAGRRASGAARRGWWLLAASSGSWMAGQATWSWYELVRHEDPFPSLADLGFLLAVPLGWSAMVSFHRAWRRSSTAGLAVLDGLAAAASLAGVSWVVFLRPGWDVDVSRFDLLLSLAYPATGAVTVAIALSVFAGAHRDARRSAGLVTIGFLVLAAADSMFALMTLHGEVPSLDVPDLAWFGGFLVLAISATTASADAAAEPTAPSPLWLGLLPYAPVVALLVIGVDDILPSGRIDPVVLASGVVMILAVLVRQAATMVENRSLVRMLGAKVLELELTERSLRHQAFHDGLTGLANRELFADRVRHALARHVRDGAEVAVLLLDLDDFKTINDSFGHGAGDALLVEAATRITGVLRPGDTVARLGGDEFAILLEAPDGVVPVANRVLGSLDAPMRIVGRDVAVRASIGWAVAGPRSTAEQLLGDADLALYAAKGSGKRTARLFEPSMRSAVVDRMELGAALELAAASQLEVHYQPIHHVGSGAVTGVEALVRWRHPDRGLLAPSVFIPLAEETGAIVDIGAAVLEKSCREMHRWRSTLPGLADLQVNVNLSGRQLLHDSLVDDVDAILRRTGLSPSALVLEITESVLTPPGPELLHRLFGLKELGLQLAVDDFGAGYSSLNYLRTLPVDVLKIDKLFVDGAGQGGQDDVLLRAIVELGHSLGLVVVAEGVEREEQLACLRDLGCERAQGYHLGRPATAGRAETNLRLLAGTRTPVA